MDMTSIADFVVIVGFFVCYVAQNGWEKFIRLWEQSQKGGKK